MESAARSSVQIAWRLENGPECPPHLLWLWNAYHEVLMGCERNGFAPPIVTWKQLESWQRLRRQAPLRQWEIDLFIVLNSIEPKSAFEDSE